MISWGSAKEVMHIIRKRRIETLAIFGTRDCNYENTIFIKDEGKGTPNKKFRIFRKIDRDVFNTFKKCDHRDVFFFRLLITIENYLHVL